MMALVITHLKYVKKYAMIKANPMNWVRGFSRPSKCGASASLNSVFGALHRYLPDFVSGCRWLYNTVYPENPRNHSFADLLTPRPPILGGQFFIPLRWRGGPLAAGRVYPR